MESPIFWILIIGVSFFAIWNNSKINGRIFSFLKNLGVLINSFFIIGIVILLIFGFFWIIGKVFGSIGNIGKYEGMTAEEWFNEYDETEAAYNELRTCIDEAITYSYDYADSHKAVQECYDNSPDL